jgi:Putative Flp pilus-assembly TadE/G-like
VSWNGRPREEGGQVLVVAALLLFALIGAAALAVDIGSLYDSKANLQEIADAASFAGAGKLTAASPADSGTCSPMPNQALHPAGYAACSTATQNLTGSNLASSAQINWTTDYLSIPTQMRVKITANSPSLFAGVFHILSSPVTVYSAANITPGSAGAPLALFADDTNCSGGLQFLKNNDTVTGAVISNGTLAIDGNESPLITGSASYGGPNHCSGPSASQVSGPITRDPAVQPYPETFGLPTTVVATCCTVTQTPICTPGPNVHISGSTGATIDNTSSGIYCSTGTLTVSPSTTATVTLIAPTVTFPGNPGNGSSADTLTAYYTDPSNGQQLLWYQNGTSPVDFPANGNNLTGVMFAPNATVTFDKNNTGSGVIEAVDITFSFNNGAGPYSGTGIPIGQSNPSILYSQ